MPFELKEGGLYLLGMLARVRRGTAIQEEIEDLANYFGYLTFTYIENGSIAYREWVNDYVLDCFRAIDKDPIINLPINCTDQSCVSDIYWNLAENKYLIGGDTGDPLRLTEKGINFVHECVALIENEGSSKNVKKPEENQEQGNRKYRSKAGRTHTHHVLRAANILYSMYRKFNPVIVPSLPLIRTGVQFRKNEKTGKLMRFLIPDLIVKFNTNLVPTELWPYTYVGVEVQTSGYDQLAAKQEKYNILAAENIDSPSLYPLYLVRNPHIKEDGTERQKFLQRVKKSILRHISDAPEWVNMVGKGRSPLLEYPNSFLPFFNIGILDDDSIEFLLRPSASLPRIQDGNAKSTERGDLLG